jgi:hypothetical protein
MSKLSRLILDLSQDLLEYADLQSFCLLAASRRSRKFLACPLSEGDRTCFPWASTAGCDPMQTSDAFFALRFPRELSE